MLRKWLIVLLVTIGLGLQVLEATGRWDRTLADTGDEAVVVAIVLCIGSAVVVAAAMRTRLSLRVIRPVIVRCCTTPLSLLSISLPSAFCDGPPISLRI